MINVGSFCEICPGGFGVSSFKIFFGHVFLLISSSVFCFNFRYKNLVFKIWINLSRSESFLGIFSTLVTTAELIIFTCTDFVSAIFVYLYLLWIVISARNQNYVMYYLNKFPPRILPCHFLWLIFIERDALWCRKWYWQNEIIYFVSYYFILSKSR
jgi:hypothetical protein